MEKVPRLTRPETIISSFIESISDLCTEYGLNQSSVSCTITKTGFSFVIAQPTELKFREEIEQIIRRHPECSVLVELKNDSFYILVDITPVEIDEAISEATKELETPIKPVVIDYMRILAGEGFGINHYPSEDSSHFKIIVPAKNFKYETFVRFLNRINQTGVDVLFNEDSHIISFSPRIH